MIRENELVHDPKISFLKPSVICSLVDRVIFDVFVVFEMKIRILRVLLFF